MAEVVAVAEVADALVVSPVTSPFRRKSLLTDGNSISGQTRTEINRQHLRIFSALSSGQGCQIFRGTTYQNGKIYQLTIKYAKLLQNISNGRKINHMAIKLTIICH
jgi:hypothetical protein